MLHNIKNRKPFIKTIIYGSYGAGKTHLACSSANNPSMCPVLLIDVEGGTVSSEFNEIKSTDQVTDIKQVEDVFWKIASNKDGYGEFNTIIVDSGSMLQNLVLLSMLGNKDLVSQKSYGTCTLRMIDIVHKFLGLEKNFIMTAFERVEYDVDPDTQIKRSKDPIDCRPDFTPRLGQRISHMFNSIWYLRKHGGKRVMITDKAGPYEAKTKGCHFSKKLGPLVENPDMAEIYNLLQETEGKQ